MSATDKPVLLTAGRASKAAALLRSDCKKLGLDPGLSSVVAALEAIASGSAVVVPAGGGPQEPDNDCVICPNCTHQFPAIPVNVQKRLNAVPAGGEPVANCSVAAQLADGLKARWEREKALGATGGQSFPRNGIDAKTARNRWAADRWDELMAEGKHGHYETLFRVVREVIEKFHPPTASPGVSRNSVLDEAIAACKFAHVADNVAAIRKLKGDAPGVEKGREAGDPLSDVLGAIARGWCSKENERKTMDPALALAIAAEVMRLPQLTTPQPAPSSEVVEALKGALQKIDALARSHIQEREYLGRNCYDNAAISNNNDSRRGIIESIKDTIDSVREELALTQPTKQADHE